VSVPPWLEVVAWVSLGVALLCVMVVMVDLFAHPQQMWIMDVVWPLTALYAGPLGLWAYFAVGRLTTKQHAMESKEVWPGHPGKQKPFWQIVGVGATHCGAGCTLGDIIAEWIAFLAPPVLTAFGLGWLWHERTFAVWTFDYIVALLLGIAFQYFSIVPMRHLSPGKGIIAAAKADVLSLTAWQLGMYGWMAIVIFAIFGPGQLHPTDAVFWFMMQIAMLCGFLTAYPVNWWLIRSGMKEKM
jgi:hypothetical protein